MGKPQAVTKRPSSPRVSIGRLCLETAGRLFFLVFATGGSNMRSKAHSRRSSMTRTRVDAHKDATLGRYATRPSDIPRQGWWQVIRRTYRELSSDRISLV